MSFEKNWNFAEKHMLAIRKILKQMPAEYFMDFAAAPAQQDMEEATDLILFVEGGTMAVRVRRHKYWTKNNDDPEWSVRFRSRQNKKTEIDKLREGLADWYFFAYSQDDKSELAAWWLVDLSQVRDNGLLDDLESWQLASLGWRGPYSNSDGSAGAYFPFDKLEQLGCILDSEIQDDKH